MLELRHVQELRGAGSDIPETRRSAMTAWEGRLLAVVTAVLVVFGLAAVYGASSLVTTAGGQVGASFALRQAVGRRSAVCSRSRSRGWITIAGAAGRGRSSASPVCCCSCRCCHSRKQSLRRSTAPVAG